MVETDFSGNFVNAENTKDGDVMEMLDEGKFEEKDWGKILNINVEVNGLKKIYSPSRDTGKRFQKAWGRDSKNWIGKKAKAFIVNYKSFGNTKQAVEFEPIITPEVKV